MSEQEIENIKDIICNNYCIQAIIEATEEVIQRYADKEVKTIAMATAYEHIREIMKESEVEYGVIRYSDRLEGVIKCEKTSNG